MDGLSKEIREVIEKIGGINEKQAKKAFDGYRMIKYYKKSKKVILASIKKGPKIGEIPLNKKTILLVDLTKPTYIQDLIQNPKLANGCAYESAEDWLIKKQWLEEIAPHTIDEVLKTLTPREEIIIRKRCGLKENDDEAETLDFIGKIFGVCREAIHQTEKKALKKLRNNLRSRKLRPLIED